MRPLFLWSLKGVGRYQKDTVYWAFDSATMKALEDITLNLNGHIWALSRSMTKPDSSKTLTDNGGAINSVSWSGKNGNRLYPTGDATHAEVAAILRASLARWLSK